MTTGTPGMTEVVYDLIRKTDMGEISWEEIPVSNSWKVTVDNLEFHIESLQDEEEKIFLYDLSETAPIPGLTGPKGEEVLGPKALGGFTYREIPKIRILLQVIQNQERRSPEYQRRMRRAKREARARAKEQEKEQQKASQEIARRYFAP